MDMKNNTEKKDITSKKIFVSTPKKERKKISDKKPVSKKSVQEVSERVNETKLEIERLKFELQKLLDRNIKKDIPLVHSEDTAEKGQKIHNDSSTENIPPKIDPPKKIESPSAKRKTFPVTASTLSTKEPAPKKVKHYDQQTARDFIKKQKQMRKEKQKEVQQTMNPQELKKQRLKELHQKTLQLVSENVKKGARRSLNLKNIEKDKTTNVRRSRSAGRIFNSDQQSVKTNRLDKNCESQSSKRSRSVSRENFPNKIIQGNKSTIKPVKHINASQPTIPKNESRRTVSNDNLYFEVPPNTDGESTVDGFQFDYASTHKSGTVDGFQFNYESTHRSDAQNSDINSERLVQFKKQKMTNSHMSSPKIAQNKSPRQGRQPMVALENYFEVCQRIRAATVIQAAYRGYRQRKKYRMALKVHRQLKNNATFETVPSETTKTTPPWLQQPQTLPYPFNFISAVKKKLSIATRNANESVNVATQISFRENVNKATSPVNTLSEHENESNVKYSDLKLNLPTLKLNRKTIFNTPENEEPIRTKISEMIEQNSTQRTELDDSDSDTTKNIPEISEESKPSIKCKPKTKNINLERPQNDDLSSKNWQDITKNINFSRSDHSNLDIELLSPPKVRLDTRKSVKPPESLKYPSDMESILSKYSKLSSRKSSNYSETFHSDHTGLSNEILTDSELKTSSLYLKKNLKNFADFKENLTDSEIKTAKTGTLSNLKKTKSLIEFDTKSNSNRTTFDLENDKQTQVNTQPVSELETIFETSKPFNTDSEKLYSGSIISESSSYRGMSKLPVDFKDMQNGVAKISTEKSAPVSFLSDVSNSTSKSRNNKALLDDKLSPKIYSSAEVSDYKTKKSSPHSEKNSEIESEIITEQLGDSEEKNLVTSQKNNMNINRDVSNLIKPTLTLKSSKNFTEENKPKKSDHHIHLKFEAELRLLNSFNNSLQQVVAVEKSLLGFDNKENEMDRPNAVDGLKAPKVSLAAPESLSPRKKINTLSKINFQRGCDEADYNFLNKSGISERSVNYESFDMEHMRNSTFSTTVDSLVPKVPNTLSVPKSSPYVSVSLDMFDKMIQDEDARIEHLKAILKIREKALIDRTKGELAWLEIQKRQLKESGQINELTAVKKKQRGLLIKYQQEKHEMQRLKKAHKTASLERKMALNEQKNLMKLQLSSHDIPTKIKRTPRSAVDKRHSGPLKVYSIHTKTEHMKSETAMSRNGSGIEEIISITSSSIVSRISEESEVESVKAVIPKNDPQMDKVKRALLMKEETLQKRRKEAEELLQWHKRLKEEEMKIMELERAAHAIPQNIPDTPKILTGAELNKFWKNITGSSSKQFDDRKKFTMSQKDLEKFFLDAQKIFREVSEEQSRLTPKRKSSFTDYVSDFEIASSIKTLDNVLDSVSSSFVTQNDNESSRSEKSDSKVSLRNLENRLSSSKTSSDSESIKTEKYSPQSIQKDMTNQYSTSQRLDNKSVTETLVSDITQQKDSAVPQDSNILSEINSEEEQNSRTKTLLNLNKTISENLIRIIKSEIGKITDTKDSNNHSGTSASISDIQESEEENKKSAKSLSDLDVQTSIRSSENILSTRNDTVSELVPEQKSVSDVNSSEKPISAQSITSQKSTSSCEEPVKDISEKIDSEIVSDIKTTPQASIEADLVAKSEINTDEKVCTLSDSREVSDINTDLNVQTNSKLPSEIKSLISDIMELSSKLDINKSLNKTEISEKDKSDILSTNKNLDVYTKTASELLTNLKSEKLPSESECKSEIKSDVDLGTCDLVDNISKDVFDSHVISYVKAHKNVQSLESSLSKIESEPQGPTVNTHSDILPVLPQESAEVKEAIEELQLVSASKAESETAANVQSISEDVYTGFSSPSSKEDVSESDDNKVEYSVQNVDIKITEPISLEITVNINNELSSDEISENIDSSQVPNEETKDVLNTCASVEEKSEFESEIDENEDVLCSKEKSETADHICEDTSAAEIVHSSEKIENAELKTHSIVLDTEEHKSTTNEIEEKLSVTETNDHGKTVVSENISPYSPVENLKPEDITSRSDSITSKDADLEHAEKQSSDVSQYKISSTSRSLAAQDSEQNKEISSKSEVCTEYKIYSNGEVSDGTVEEERISVQSEDINKSKEEEEICSSRQSENINKLSEQEEICSSRLEIDNEISITSQATISPPTEKKSQSNSQTSQNDIDKLTEDSPHEHISPKPSNNEELQKISPKSYEESYNSEFEADFESNKTDHSSNSQEIHPNLELNLDDLISESTSSLTSNAESVDTVKGSSDSRSDSHRDETNLAGVSHIDVRKRVSEILADSAGVSRGDKSPRLQDFYVTTYDVMSPSPGNSPEISSPTEEFDVKEKRDILAQKTFYGEEAEELLRKQLEIEQEIKRLEQQQKDSVPYCYVREIPNKPPPPYKPPPVSIVPAVTTVIPSESRQLKTYLQKASAILYDDYDTGKLSEKSHPNIGDKINSYRFVFDLCKEIALDMQEKLKDGNTDPSWMQIKPRLKPMKVNKAITKEGLQSVMTRKVEQLLGFQTISRKDNLIVRWSRKKRDHVDEILVLEAQTEEADWTNYDQDELTVKDNLTKEILDMLVSETAQVLSAILKKKRKHEIL